MSAPYPSHMVAERRWLREVALHVGDKPKTQEERLGEHWQRSPGEDEEKPRDDAESADLDVNVDALMKAIVRSTRVRLTARSLQSDMHDVTGESSRKRHLEMLRAMVLVSELACN